MSSMFQEIVAFFFSTAGWILESSTLPTDYWKVSSDDGSVITTASFWSNLWKTCVTDSTGVSNCKEFISMLALDGQLFSVLIIHLSFILDFTSMLDYFKLLVSTSVYLSIVSVYVYACMVN